MPDKTQYTRDQLLTNLSIAQQNDPNAFIADKVFPVAPVDAESGTYYEFDLSNISPESDLRADGAPANEIDYGMEEKSFGPLLDHSLEIKVTDKQVKRSKDPLKPFENASRVLTEKILIGKEVDAAAKLAAATKGITVSDAADRWDAKDTSDPLGMLKDAIEAFYLNAMIRPNVLTLGGTVASVLLDHPDVLGRLPDNALRNAKLQHLAELLDIDRIYVGDALRNTAVEGAAVSKGRIWGKHAFLQYVTDSPELNSVSSTFTLELLDGNMVERYREEKISSTWTRKSRQYEHKITCQDAIYKLLNVIN